MRAPGLYNPLLTQPRASGLTLPTVAGWNDIKQELKKRHARRQFIPETVDTSIAWPTAIDTKAWGAILLPTMEDILFSPMNDEQAYTFNIKTRQFTAVKTGLTALVSKFRGISQHPNGTCVLTPFGNQHFGTYVNGVFTEDVTSVPTSVSNGTKYEGIVLGADGNFYTMPHDTEANWSSSTTNATYTVTSNVVTVTYTPGAHGLRVGDRPSIDFVGGSPLPADNQSAIITEVPASDSFRFNQTTGNVSSGGTCRIGAARPVCKITPDTVAASHTPATFLSSGGSGASRFKCEGTTLGPGGLQVYGVPLWDNCVPVYDIASQTLAKYGNFYNGSPAVNTGFGKYRGGRLTWNDWIYMGLYSTDRFAKIHAYTKEVVAFGPTYATNGVRNSGVVQGPNGLLYCIPRSDDTIAVIDPATDTIRGLATGYVSSTDEWIGGILAPDGRIYCAPFNADHLLIIDTGIRDFPPEMCLSPYLNNF